MDDTGDGEAPVPGRDPMTDGTLDIPNCPACLHQMMPAVTLQGGVFWACPHCGQTRVA